MPHVYGCVFQSCFQFTPSPLPNALLHLLLEEKRTLPPAQNFEVVVDAGRGIGHDDAIFSPRGIHKIPRKKQRRKENQTVERASAENLGEVSRIKELYSPQTTKTPQPNTTLTQRRNQESPPRGRPVECMWIYLRSDNQPRAPPQKLKVCCMVPQNHRCGLGLVL